MEHLKSNQQISWKQKEFFSGTQNVTNEGV